MSNISLALVNVCHHLSTQLNCLIGLASSITSIVMILPVTCTFHMSVPLSHVFPHSLCLTLGQRLSWMYYISYRCLVVQFATLEGFLLLSRHLGILVYM